MVRKMRLIGAGAMALAVFLGGASGPAGAAKSPSQKAFPTPEAAGEALVKAAGDNDEAALLDLFGHEHKALLPADKAQARVHRELFAAAAKELLTLREEGDQKVVLVVGANAWPFPIPLVREGGNWYFDTPAGADELLNRRIGANELDAIKVLQAYVAAQQEYASKARQGDGVRQFAGRLRSTPGRKDGLYWEAKAGEEGSPFGPLIAEAGPRLKGRKAGDPYMGYYFKILTGQGAAAPGGAYNYVINGRLLAGFAMVAYPVQYRNTGVMTFVVNHYGIVYQKDLGPNTRKVAEAMKAYNPDRTWTEVKE